MTVAEIVKTVLTVVITAAVTGAITYLSLQLKMFKALKDGLLSLLRAEIIRSHEKYTKREYCPIYAEDAITKAYNAYHALGGNGTITKLYNELMELPNEPQEVHK